MFRVGQRVECIDGSRLLGLIKTGDKLTICNIIAYPEYITLHGVVGLEFSDAPLPPLPYAGYRATCFRPLVENENKTDISVFKKLLKTTKIKEDA